MKKQIDAYNKEIILAIFTIIGMIWLKYRDKKDFWRSSIL